MSTIPANDANLAYSPYTWQVNSTRAKTINAGAYLTAVFSGSTDGLAATFDLTGLGSPYAVIEWRVDGGPWTIARIAASVAMSPPATVNWSTHIVEIRVDAIGSGSLRWASQTTAVIFTGITATGAITAQPAPARSVKILAIGDSILEGLVTNGTPAVAPAKVHNATTGWGYPLRDLLGVELGMAGFGGVGLTSTTSDADDVPVFINNWKSLWNGVARDLTTAPTLIVNHVGTNDGGTSAAALTTATVAFLNSQLAATPSTTRIALVRNWLGVGADGIKAGIAQCAAPSRVSWIDTTGWWDSTGTDGYHPFGHSNLTTLAPRLAAALRPLLTISTGAQLIWNGTAWV